MQMAPAFRPALDSCASTASALEFKFEPEPESESEPSRKCCGKLKSTRSSPRTVPWRATQPETAADNPPERI